VLEFDVPPPPAGFESLGCFGTEFSIDSLGRVLSGVRDDNAAWVAAWEPELDEWSLLGLPMSVQGIEFGSVSGEWVPVYTFGEDVCGPTAPFVDPPADALLPYAAQLIGVESQLAVPAGQAIVLDDRRVCATWRSYDLSARIVHDLADGEELVLPFRLDAGWFEP
jgi:hypothetical protein